MDDVEELNVTPEGGKRRPTVTTWSARRGTGVNRKLRNSAWGEPFAVYSGIVTAVFVLLSFVAIYVVFGPIGSNEKRITDVSEDLRTDRDETRAYREDVRKSLSTIVDAINTGKVDDATFRSEISGELINSKNDTIHSINKTKDLLAIQIAKVDANTVQSSIKQANFDATQHKQDTNIANIVERLDRITSEVEQEVTEEVTEVAANYQSNVDEVKAKMTATNEAFAEDVKVQKERLRELESSQTEADGKLSAQEALLSRQAVMLENGIVHRDIVRVVNKLFDNNPMLSENPAMLTPILAGKPLVGARQFAIDLRDEKKYGLSMSRDDALIISFGDALLIGNPKSFYDENVISAEVIDGDSAVEPEQGAAQHGTADDYAPLEHKLSSSKQPDATSEEPKISILDACAELVAELESRGGCYLHYLDKLSDRKPEIESARKFFSNSESERIRRINRRLYL